MTNPVVRLRRIKTVNGSYHAITMWCPGCEERNPERRRGGLNMIGVSGDPDQHPVWSWNGDLEKPTVTPSILVRYPIGDTMLICHSFLTDGIWNFLDDCTHDLAGQKVPMVPLPDWAIRD